MDRQRWLVMSLIFGCFCSCSWSVSGKLFRAVSSSASGRRAFLLPAVPAHANRMGARSNAALGAGGEFGHSPTGQPDCGGSLSWQAHLCLVSVCLGRPAYTSLPTFALAFVAMLLAMRRVVRKLGWLGTGCVELHLRRTNLVSVL